MWMRFIILLCFAAGAHGAAVKLAISESSPHVSVIGSMLTATLSKNPSISLLERAELDKALRERSLAATQFTNILTASQILGADGVVMLSASGATNESIHVRLITVKEGAVLFSTVASALDTNVQRWVEIVSSQISETAAKIPSDRSRVVPISVLNFRSPTSSAQSELLDRELTSLVLLRLSRQTNLLVLERRKLLDVAFEKDLAARSERFWSGAYLLDGIVNKAGVSPNQTTVSARLIAADRSVTNIEVSGARTNLAAVVEQLITKALNVLKVDAAAPWDQQSEAREHAEEAAWSLRWGMYPEAQAAGDSAWALGFRTRRLAVTRTLAHARDYAAFGPSFSSTASAYRRIILVDRLPSRERFESIYRGAAILHDFLTSDPDAVSYPEVYPAVCEFLGSSGNILQAYHFSMEARQGLEDQLAELRAMSRKIEAIARANPDVRRPFWNAASAGLDRNKIYRYLNGTNVVTQTAKYTAMFQDTPEGAIEVYRDLMQADAFPFLRLRFSNRTDKPPLVSAWNWADRERSFTVWDAFVRELLSSTNLFTQIEGRMLELRDQTDWPTFQSKFEEFWSALDSNAAQLKARQPSMQLVDVSAIPFRGGGARIEDLQQFDRIVAQRVVDSGFAPSISLNGESIVPSKAPPKTIAASKPSAGPVPAPFPRSDELVITDVWKVDQREGRPGRQLQSPIFREGKLWFRLATPTNEFAGWQSQIFAVDLASTKHRLIPAKPGKSDRPFTAYLNDHMRLPKSLEVRSNILYAVEGAAIDRVNLATGAKSSIPIPESDADIYQVNGRLYLSGAANIFELGENGEAKLLASARRRPAASLLDELETLDFAPLTAGPKGSLRAFVKGRGYLWNGTEWRREIDAGELQSIVFDNGAFLATVGFPAFVQLHSISSQETHSRYLAAALVATRDPQSMRDQTNQWTLSHHNQILHGAPAFVGETPVLYLQSSVEKPADPDCASLLVLGPSANSPVEIPLRFERSIGRGLREKYDLGLRRPWLLDTSAGLVIGHNGFAGFCLIPRDNIDTAMTRATRRAGAAQTSSLPRP
jgi:hypothetical protein